MNNNPFHNLADDLAILRKSTGSFSSRLLELASGEETLRDVHRQLFTTYWQCHELLQEAGRDESIKLVLNPVWDFLMSTEARWDVEAPELLNPLQIEAVRLLGNDADIQKELPKSLTKDELEALRVIFVKIQEVISSHEFISKEFAAHIIYLCRRAINLIDGETVDLVTLRSISFETITLVQGVSVTLPEEAQRTIWESVLRLWKGWGYPIAQDVAANLLSAGASSVLGIGS